MFANVRRSRLPLLILLAPLVLGAAADVDERKATILGVEASPCPVRLLAGEHVCPGCGLTRSTALAVQGDWASSWHVHPAGILVAVLCVAGVLLFVPPTVERELFGRKGMDMIMSGGESEYFITFLLSKCYRAPENQR